MEKFLTDVCDIGTGKLDANNAVDNGKYPFFTCAPQPSYIDTYEFDEDAILLAGNNAQGNFHINRYQGKFNAYQRTYVITAKDGYDIDYIKWDMKEIFMQGEIFILNMVLFIMFFSCMPALSE